ncbi:hypothetical protein J4407_02235 [Candidatus Pacearchaeota archaeon]|nr:hypothetical protein [Candidatus Pacearchaeota archaeon]
MKRGLNYFLGVIGTSLVLTTSVHAQNNQNNNVTRLENRIGQAIRNDSGVIKTQESFRQLGDIINQRFRNRYGYDNNEAAKSAASDILGEVYNTPSEVVRRGIELIDKGKNVPREGYNFNFSFGKDK